MGTGAKKEQAGRRLPALRPAEAGTVLWAGKKQSPSWERTEGLHLAGLQIPDHHKQETP